MKICHKMLNIGIRKHLITNKLLVYIHITLKKAHKISVNFSNSICVNDP